MRQPNPIFVFDAYALLAFVLDEPGAAAVQERLSAARDGECLVLVSAMSVGEVCYIIERRNGIEAVEASLALLEALPIRIVEVDRPIVLKAARIKARYPISLGDAFVVALAVDRGATVVTGDREFKRVEPIVPVLWLSQREEGPAER